MNYDDSIEIKATIHILIFIMTSGGLVLLLSTQKRFLPKNFITTNEVCERIKLV